MKIKEKTMHVLSFDDIVLHSESIDIINRLERMYTEVKHDDFRVISNPIVHLYPWKDTMNEDGELHGFQEVLFFETRIYDSENLTYSNCGNDSVDTSQAKVKGIKIFKDGSTMIEFDGEYRFSNNTTLSAYKPKKPFNNDDCLPINPFD